MLIAHISDLHIVEAGKQTYNIAPMAENLSRCIEHINQLQPRPDLVLVTGDICNNGSVEQTEHAASILRSFDIPYYLVPGNHDRRENIWKCFGGGACPARSGDFINYVIDDFDKCLIGLDTTWPGNPGGQFCPERASWLDEQLAATNGRPTIIFMHHPPVKCGVLETDEDGFDGVELLKDIVSRHDNIERILCGHIHLPVSAQWCGIQVNSASSTGMLLGLDLSLQLPSQFYLDEPSYLLHYSNDDGLLITHMVSTRNNDGPFSFEEH